MPFGLIFDMDGVLADTEGLSVRATRAMFEELYGVSPAPEDFTPFVGKGAIRYVEGPAEKLGVRIETEKAVQRRTELFVELLNSGEYIAFPGVQDLIRAMAARPEWRLAIATSSPADKAEATLRAAQIPLECFKTFVNGSMVSNRKPDPELFLKAAEQIGLPPHLCVGVEDAPPGIEALRAAGMKSIGVTSSFGAEALEGADLIVPSIQALEPGQIERLLS